MGGTVEPSSGSSLRTAHREEQGWGRLWVSRSLWSPPHPTPTLHLGAQAQWPWQLECSHLPSPALAEVTWGTQRLVAQGGCPGSVTQCACKKINPLKLFFFLSNKEMRLTIHPWLPEESSFPALVTAIKSVILVQG